MKHPQAISNSALLRWSGCTHRGKRPNNEDAFLALRFDAMDVQRLGKTGDASTAKTDFTFAVSDGMGGALAGEYASRIAVEKIATMLPRSFKQSASGLVTGYDDVLTELFGEVHKALVYLGASYEECSGMEATLTLCWFTPGWMHFGHIGDSRLYYLPAKSDKIRQLSHDDTHVGWLFRNGKINEREARTHPRRNVLQKALGGGNQFVDPQLGAVAYESGDLFLLCTDGLVEGLYNHHVVEILRTMDAHGPNADPSDRLVKEALEKSGRDNTTALIIEVI
ncbi:MAG TPA: protein phosphatase 2C domain-containing protein [Candidatus Angelobacter sp.]|nr:protein phosphatase 2C domain-containing protein [Candidatus Angelobacter sp.]